MLADAGLPDFGLEALLPREKIPRLAFNFTGADKAGLNESPTPAPHDTGSREMSDALRTMDGTINGLKELDLAASMDNDCHDRRTNRICQIELK